MTVDSQQALIEAVRQGMGMGVIASHLAYEEISGGRVVPVTTRRKEIIDRISLEQVQDKVPGLTEKTFQAYFKTAVQAARVRRQFRMIDIDDASKKRPIPR